MHAGFQPENWKTKSMKLGKGMGSAAVSGAVGAKNMTVSGAKRYVHFRQHLTWASVFMCCSTMCSRTLLFEVFPEGLALKSHHDLPVV